MWFGETEICTLLKANQYTVVLEDLTDYL